MFLLKSGHWDYGITGTPTKLVDIFDRKLEVGDLVYLECPTHSVTQIVVEDSKKQFIMGICGSCLQDGTIINDWEVKLIKKWYNVKPSDYRELEFIPIKEEYWCFIYFY